MADEKKTTDLAPAESGDAGLLVKVLSLFAVVHPSEVFRPGPSPNPGLSVVSPVPPWVNGDVTAATSPESEGCLTSVR